MSLGALMVFVNSVIESKPKEKNNNLRNDKKAKLLLFYII